MTPVKQKQGQPYCYWACLESILKDFGIQNISQDEIHEKVNENRVGMQPVTNLMDDWVQANVSLFCGINLSASEKKNKENLPISEIFKAYPDKEIIVTIPRQLDNEHWPAAWNTHAVRVKKLDADSIKIMDPGFDTNHGKLFGLTINECLFDYKASDLDKLRTDGSKTVHECFVISKNHC